MSDKKKYKFVRVATKVVHPGGILSHGQRIRITEKTDSVHLVITTLPLVSASATKFDTTTMKTTLGRVVIPLQNGREVRVVDSAADVSRTIPQNAGHKVTEPGSITTVRLSTLGGGIFAGDVIKKPLFIGDLQTWFDTSCWSPGQRIFASPNWNKTPDRHGLEWLWENKDKSLKKVNRPLFETTSFAECVDGRLNDATHLNLQGNIYQLKKAVSLHERYTGATPIKTGFGRFFSAPYLEDVVWVEHNDWVGNGYMFRDTPFPEDTGVEEVIGAIQDTMDPQHTP